MKFIKMLNKIMICRKIKTECKYCNRKYKMKKISFNSKQIQYKMI